MPDIDEPPEGGPDHPGEQAAFDWLCILAFISVPMLIWLFIAAA